MSLFVLRHTAEDQEALAKLLARKYVKRGERWLNRNAPLGWYRNCLNGGTSRIHTAYGNEGILAIAFEYRAEFADNSGYINEGKVLRHFGFWPFSRAVHRFGFETPLGDFKPFAMRYPGIRITNKTLDECWAELLEDPKTEWRIPYRHPTAFDRRYAEMSFADERPTPSFRQWLKRVLGIRLTSNPDFAS